MSNPFERESAEESRLLLRELTDKVDRVLEEQQAMTRAMTRLIELMFPDAEGEKS